MSQSRSRRDEVAAGTAGVDVAGHAADLVDAPPVTPFSTAAAAAAPFAEALAKAAAPVHALDDESNFD